MRTFKQSANMRLDHIAYRVKDKWQTARFFIDCFGYRIADDLPDGFEITFEDDSKARCLVLLPPEKTISEAPWTILSAPGEAKETSYHMAPEIFISEGSPGSIVEAWVQQRGGIGGIHHLAYQVNSVEEKMEEWRSKGYAEFTTEHPLSCPGLKQVFTKPSALTGVIYEFIERETHGFCKENVKSLMESTQNLS
jgi:catechol 2,3-dioxygenase-like lactoylglutathione lyase family enzyme